MTSCFFASDSTLRTAHKGCQGRLQAHHVIGQNKLKRYFRYGALRVGDYCEPASYYTRPGPDIVGLDEILADERNSIWLCDRHHQFVTNHRIYIPRSAMASVEEFAADYGLEALLDKVAPAEEAA